MSTDQYIRNLIFCQVDFVKFIKKHRFFGFNKAIKSCHSECRTKNPRDRFVGTKKQHFEKILLKKEESVKDFFRVLVSLLKS